MKKKTTLRMLALLTIIVCSIVAPILIQDYLARAWKLTAAKGSYDPDYMAVSGVLSTDKYVLFPWQKKNLTIGFSKYGEMIDYDLKIGMDYGGTTDPWAPNTNYVSEYEWVEGWVINITYWHEDAFYNRWAFALYSDYSGASGVGGDWIEDVTGGALNTTVPGGRKTNGGAITQPIKVLYNGPRRFVAFLDTTIYESSAHTYPLVRVTFTIVFNKVKKQAIWFKDIKRVESPKRWGNLQVEFGERGQWDLASDTGESSGNAPLSYACFFANQSTYYNNNYTGWYTGAPTGFDGTYDVVQIVDDKLDYVAWGAYWPKPIKHWVDDIGSLSNKKIYTTTSTVEQNWTGDGSDTTFVCNEHNGPAQYPRDESSGSWSEAPMVYVDNNHQVEGSDYTYSAGTDTITFTSAPSSGADIRAYYKVGTQHGDPATEDDVPGTGVEPCSPFTNAEWCFEMDASTDMFRCVTAFGVTDRCDGDDADNSANVLDTEIKYYLNQTFNPYDLYNAVHKDTRRWVDFHNVTSSEATADRVTFNLTHKPVIKPTEWTEYCTWSEKVEWGGALRTPYRSNSQFDGYNYTFYRTSSDGMGNITITGNDVPSAGTIIKVLYSTNATWQEEKTDLGTFGNTSRTIASGQTGLIIPNTAVNSTTWTDPFGTTYEIQVLFDKMYAKQLSSNNSTAKRTDDLQLTLDIKIRPESGYVKAHNSTYYYADTTSGSSATNTTFNGNMSIMFKATPPNTTQTSRFRYPEHLYITGNILIRSNHTYVYNTHVAMANYTVVYANLTTKIGGSYEWIVVGKDAATIDSLGAAYATEAFDSIKEIKVCIAGMDIKDTTYGPNAPFVMGGASSGTKSDYRDSLNRTFLKDDWCRRIYMSGTTTRTQHIYPGYPVSTSNMIFAGGPVAQMGTDYFNEFTDAFYAHSQYVINNTGCAAAHSNKIVALSCWGKNVTSSNYAVIAVYKDINGTIGLVIWGYDGQDTYYASKWFWDGLGAEPGIQYLQTMNRGVTAIILKITYPSTDPTHPSVSIVERLGTISEKDYHDP